MWEWGCGCVLIMQYAVICRPASVLWRARLSDESNLHSNENAKTNYSFIFSHSKLVPEIPTAQNSSILIKEHKGLADVK